MFIIWIDHKKRAVCCIGIFFVGVFDVNFDGQIPGSNMARQISTPISCKLWVSWPHRKFVSPASAVGEKKNRSGGNAKFLSEFP